MSHNAIGLLKANGEIEEYGNTGGGGGDTSTLANKTDLTAIILTGTTNTSGDTITAGTWFYLNGLLVKAKADIANGATFTENTNYEAKTVGDELSELNSNITYGTTNLNGIYWRKSGNLVIINVVNYMGTGNNERITGIPTPAICGTSSQDQLYGGGLVDQDAKPVNAIFYSYNGSIIIQSPLNQRTYGTFVYISAN